MNTLSPHPPAVRTTCPYCGVGCGILAAVDRQGDATISGDPAHPANFGRLCSKGSALGETLSLDQRLLHPMFRQADGSLARTDWDTALAKVANGLRTIVDRDGPNAIAFYLSGQLLTEDYYVANKLMKGFLGSSNVDTNSRLCMASSVAGHRRAFGADVVPGIYRDLDEADLIVLVGSNAAWCHPVLYQRMIAAKNERGARLVVIDPRRTATADAADLFLPIASGMDTALFCGLLAYLADTRALNDSYIAEYTRGFADALARAREIAGDAAATARASGLDLGEVARFFELFARTERVVTCYSQGVNQSAQGTDKVNAIINVHLATGRIGRPGMGPFSLTGQPNAMGGREVGGLANQLAAHMGFSPAETDRVRRFWNAPRMAASEGLKAVDMFEAIERGTIKALWVMATNPAVSLPRAGAFRAALKKLELFIVSETTLAQRHRRGGRACALACGRLGRERRHRHQFGAAYVAPASVPAAPRRGAARLVDRQRSGPAPRLRRARFAYREPADIFREHAALSAFENDGRRDFDLGGLAALADDDYDRLDSVMWPLSKAGRTRRNAFLQRRRVFHRAIGVAASLHRNIRGCVRRRATLFRFASTPGACAINGTRMTRTGQSPRLGAHSPEPKSIFTPMTPRWPAFTMAASRRSRRSMAARCFGFAFVRVSSAARSLRRFTGAMRRRPMRASARWRWRTTIRFPASPSSRPRRRASNRSSLPIAALRSRAS